MNINTNNLTHNPESLWETECKKSDELFDLDIQIQDGETGVDVELTRPGPVTARCTAMCNVTRACTYHCKI